MLNIVQSVLGEKMTSFDAQHLYSWISAERLETYRLPNDSDLSMVTNYLYNVSLCEALYTSLHFLEISLRNTLHTQISRFYGSPAWYLLPNTLESSQLRDVQKVTARIQGRGKPVTPGRVISELNFGFWVSLLSGGYETRLWRPNRAIVLKAAFPNIPKSLRQRTTIYKQCNELREFRNRVFHHEPIWNRLNLSDDFASIYEVIHWISPNMVALSRTLDRFPEVISQGRSAIQVELRKIATFT
jgi:hypothetical protein